MAKPRRNLRLFVGIYPSEPVATRLSEVAATIAPLVDGRCTREEQLHITAMFLGDTPTAGLDDVIESVNRSVSGLHSFTLQIERLIALPEVRAARLIAAETNLPGPLGELHDRLVTRLAHGGRSGRPFRPHLTLVRLRRPAAVDESALQGLLPEEPLTWHVETIHLMRSTLSHAGAQHHEVDAIRLGRSGHRR